MKFGFRVLIHKDIPLEDFEQIKPHLQQIIDGWSKHGYKCRLKSGAYFRRSILGYPIVKDKYVLRRLVKTRRLFGMVPVELLEGVDEQINFNQCMCGDCLAGTKVRFIKRFDENDYWKFYEIGEIKG
jgi:hypothetical protein